MNQKTYPVVPDENRIEELIAKIQPVPSEQFHASMERRSWRAQERQEIRNVRLKFVFAVVAVVTLIGLLISPQGRTFAQSFLQFFVRMNSDKLPLQSFQLTPIPKTITPDPGYIFDQSITAAGEQAGFIVQVPEFLPDSLSFGGASYEAEHNIVRLFYNYKNIEGNGLVLREERFQTNDDCELCGTVGASAEVQLVKINEGTGEYVEGVWNLTDRGPIWVSDPWLKTLRWQKDGIAFEMVFMGDPEEFTKMDLIAIAESIK